MFVRSLQDGWVAPPLVGNGAERAQQHVIHGLDKETVSHVKSHYNYGHPAWDVLYVKGLETEGGREVARKGRKNMVKSLLPSFGA